MSNQDNAQMYLEMMEFVDDLRACLESSKEIEQKSFEEVTPEIWRQVLILQKPFQFTVQRMIETMPDVAKIASNPALMAHVAAVKDAD